MLLNVFEDSKGLLKADRSPPKVCSCHPDDRPEPCPRKQASSECWRAAVYEETNQAIIDLKGRDRSELEQKLLDYFMRVRRAVML